MVRYAKKILFIQHFSLLGIIVTSLHKQLRQFDFPQYSIFWPQNFERAKRTFVFKILLKNISIHESIEEIFNESKNVQT